MPDDLPAEKKPETSVAEKIVRSRWFWIVFIIAAYFSSDFGWRDSLTNPLGILIVAPMGLIALAARAGVWTERIDDMVDSMAVCYLINALFWAAFIFLVARSPKLPRRTLRNLSTIIIGIVLIDLFGCHYMATHGR